MNIHTDTPTWVDRVALSSALFEVAECFALEATLWTGRSGEARGELDRSARLLAELARHVLTGSVDYAMAEAFLDAGRIRLGQAVGGRRFVKTLGAPPNRPGPAADRPPGDVGGGGSDA